MGNSSGSSSSTTYTYFATFAVAICKGPIAGVVKIWADSKLVYNTDSADPGTLSANALVPVTFFLGGESQSPSSLMESFEGAGNVPAYRGVAYALFERLPLKNYGNRIPNLTFEVVTAGASQSSSGSSNYKLIAHCNGADDATAFADSSVYQRDGTGSGGQIQTAHKVFGTAGGVIISLASRVKFDVSSDWDLSPNIAWQIKLRVYKATSSNGTAVLIGTGGTAGAPGGWSLRWNSSAAELYFTHSSGTKLSVTHNLDQNIWYAVCLSCDGAGNLRFYVNGAQLGTTKTLGAITNSTRALTLGATDGVSDNSVQWYFDEVIFQKGGTAETGTSYAVETSEFTPPTPAPGVDVAGQNLKDIVADIVQKSGLAASDYDVSQINEQTVWTNAEVTVKGFIVNSPGTTARKAIEDLATAFLFEVFESDTKLHFRHRNNTINTGSILTIQEDELGASAPGSKLPNLLEVARVQEVELPRAVELTYLNQARSYWAGLQRAQHFLTSSVLKSDVNLPIALDDNQAKVAAMAALMIPWAERRTYHLLLSSKYAYLDVGDIITAVYNGGNHQMRIAKTTFDQGVVDISAASQDFTGTSAINQSTALGAPGPVVVPTISYPAASALRLLDINLILDAHDGPGYYVSADKGLSANFWPSAGIYKSSDNNAFGLLMGISSAVETGTATNSLGSGPVTIFDRGNSVNIAMTNGQLFSDAEANVLNGANIGILGNEIIQWATAALETDGSYTLTNLLRGRRGTEWAIGSHSIGDRFYLFKTATVQRATGALDEIGLLRYYKAVTSGRPAAGESSIQFANMAVGLKPYSPVHIAGSRNGAGDLTLTWIRRTRIGGGWRDYVDAGLGESLEQYSIDVMNGAAVVRTIDGVFSQTAIYAADRQTADFGSPQSSVSVKIHQISPDVGRGYAGAATI